MERVKRIVLVACLMIFVGSVNAQSVDVESLPKYVVVGAEDTKLLGGIGIYIAKKKSDSKDSFYYLEYYLHSTKKVRTVTDLLNAMDELGFDYVDTFNSGSKSMGVGDGYSQTAAYGDREKSRYSIVFKKSN